MRVVHEPEGEATILATNVETADTSGEQLKGLMGRSSIPDDYAMVFRFEDPPFWTPAALANWRSIHMLFVRFPLDVVWLLDGEVRQVKTLQPWRGVGMAKADTILELPAGAADGMEAGDAVVVED
ncbi:hypothetical protein SAMN05216559_0970 [Halomicrobium zhouii]|uniref:DUF192 domain-containing protein n=1 Tax=Halomicrobium zhouii TaxID=767519 RepID=A0A1I6KKL3_9EURY|nr:DUF192 domain-containing protein [Halomicrobium zhouii]SFR91802.1 hypothetical protein SAMN05216559_0970 [Halomicrobium zhouii]